MKDRPQVLDLSSFSSREKQVAILLARNYSYMEIAELLDLSTETIKACKDTLEQNISKNSISFSFMRKE